MVEVTVPTTGRRLNAVGAAENDRGICSEVQQTADCVRRHEAKLNLVRQIEYGDSAVEFVLMIFMKVV